MSKIFILIVSNIFGPVNIQTREKTKNLKGKTAYFSYEQPNFSFITVVEVLRDRSLRANRLLIGRK